MKSQEVDENQVKERLNQLTAVIAKAGGYRFNCLISVGNFTKRDYLDVCKRRGATLLAYDSSIPWFLFPLRIISASMSALIAFKDADSLVEESLEMAGYGSIHLLFFNQNVVDAIKTDFLSSKWRFNPDLYVEKYPEAIVVEVNLENAPQGYLSIVSGPHAVSSGLR